MDYAPILREFGLKDDLEGFHLAQTVLKKMEGKRLPVIMGSLYMEVAEEVNATGDRKTTPSRIERVIRHATEIAFGSKVPNTSQKFWRRCPTQKEFLHRVFGEAQSRRKAKQVV